MKSLSGGCGSGNQPFEIRVFSLNAQSLRGKHRYFEDQLEALRCNLVLFQETKSSSSLVESRAYQKLGSDGQSHWGVAVWVHKRLGVLSVGGRACHVKEADIHVVYEGPRLLILSFVVQGRRLVVFSGHCPHSARAEEAKDFILALKKALHPYKKSALIVGGLDLNGRVATGVTQVTGDVVFGDVTDLAAFLHLWFPSTFSRLHVGEHMTYQQANGAEHRIDYIILGGAAEVRRLRSWVEFGFDSASPNDDHWPVMMHVEGTIQAPDADTDGSTVWRPSYDTERMMTDKGKEILQRRLSAYEHPSWQMDPSEHCQHLQDFLHEVMQSEFAKEEARPRAAYIPDEVWTLRASKLGFKQRTRYRQRFWLQMLPRAFLQWKEWSDYQVTSLISKQGLLYELAAAAIRFATALIKRGIAKGKAEYLKGLALAAGPKAGDIVTLAKKAGVGGRSTKAFVRPLPILLDKEGKPSCQPSG